MKQAIKSPIKQDKLPHHPLLDYFYEICKIPHTSFHEKELSKWIINELKKFGATVQTDKFNNVYAYLPETQGCSNIPSICLQGHLDMVGAKIQESKHDFLKDPIDVYEENGFLKARGTTLGADNGIGVASILAIASNKKLKHGPIEILLTTNEEENQSGAQNIKPGIFKSKYLLNLDNEGSDMLLIGSGGRRTISTKIPVKRQRAKKCVYLKLSLSNLISGHSGLSIDQKRANAIKEMFYIIMQLNKHFDLRLIDATANGPIGLLPPKILVNISVPKKDLEKIKLIFYQLANSCKTDFSELDKNMLFDFEIVNEQKFQPLTKSDSNKIINFICASCSGVKQWYSKYSIPEVSNNLAVMYLDEKDNFVIKNATRSNNSYDLEKSVLQTVALNNLLDIESEVSVDCEPWLSSDKSELAKQLISVGKNYGINLYTKVVHAGVEIAEIQKKYPNTDAICMGFDIYDIHTPNERLLIKSVLNSYEFLCGFLTKLK